MHRVHRLGDPHGGRGPALQVDGDRVAQHVAGEREDRRRHGGAEEQRLPLGGQVAEDLPDLGEKAHVEHPVRLVQHQDLEPGQPGVGLGEVIQQPAGSRDDDIHPAPEGVLLRTHADPAEHGRRRDRRVHREIVDVLHDLCGQLTGRGEDEGPVVPRGLSMRRCRIGSPKAAVLPLPVMAQARTSRPARAGGTASAWIGVGRAKPSSFTPLRRLGWSFSEVKGNSPLDRVAHGITLEGQGQQDSSEAAG